MRNLIVLEGVSLDGIFDAETMGQWAAPCYCEKRDEVIRKTTLASDALLHERNIGSSAGSSQAVFFRSKGL